MRVLIVGCGYVGQALGAELARQGHEVFGFRRTTDEKAAMEAAGIRPLFGDITRMDDLAKLPGGHDWVVNCVSSGGGDAADYRRIYVQGTLNLIEWLAPQPPQKFVYTGSTSVYGQNDGAWVDESSPTEPVSETARALLETEWILLEAARQKAFPAVILRAAGIYGPGRGYWFRQFLQGDAQMNGNGERILNMIHRDDLAGIVILALAKSRGGQIYNAVDDEPVSLSEFYRWLVGELGRPLPSSGLATRDTAGRRATNKRISNRKLKSDLGYQFRYPDFREGFRGEIQRLRDA